MRTLGVATLSLLLVLSAGCTRAVSDKATVTVQFPSENSNTSASQQKQVVTQNMGALAAPKWGLPVPTDVNDFNCYALFLQIPNEERVITCQYGTQTFRLNSLYGVFKKDSEISIEVTAGTDRVFGLVGFYTDDPSYCVDLGDVGGTLDAAHFSPPVLLTTTKIASLPPGNFDVSLSYPTSMNASGVLEFEDCDTKPFASATIIGATASGLPTGVSNVTSGTATVNLFNAAQYSFEIKSGTTCSENFSPSPGNWYSVTDNISYDLEALDIGDGAVTLCLYGKNSKGEVQAQPTVYTWERDTLAPSPPYMSINNQNNPPIANFYVSEFGITINIFASKSPSPDCFEKLASFAVSSSANPISYILKEVSTLEEPGDYTLTAQAVDAAGNFSSCSVQKTLTIPLQMVPPAGP